MLHGNWPTLRMWIAFYALWAAILAWVIVLTTS
jgi:hypothetical protein